MRKLLITLLFIVLMIPIHAQEDKETKPTVPDLSGLTAPEAASELNKVGLLLDSEIQPTTNVEANETLNTIVKQLPEAGTEITADTTTVTITVLRENNLLLLYDPNTWSEDDITFVNTSDTGINLTGITFTSDTGNRFEAREFAQKAGRILPAQKCFQAWGRPTSTGEFYTPDECKPDRLLSIISDLPDNQHFWQNSSTFTVTQDGVYRGRCDVAAGRCELWVSPEFIAEDVTEYAYFVYDEHQLIVFNRAENQWMPLNQIELVDMPHNESENLDSSRIWSSRTFKDTELHFLAPGQCAIFTDGSQKDPLVDCFSMAQKIYPSNDLFWSDGFTVKSSHPDGIERNCPAPSGTTFCMTPRYEWDR